MFKVIGGQPSQPLPGHATEAAPAQERHITSAELAAANGEGDKPIYIAVKNPFGPKTTVFDVSSGKEFYGPGGSYHIFAAKDASFALATSSLKPDALTGDLSKLTESQKDTLVQWYNKYSQKYKIVGYLVTDDESVDTKKTA